MEELYFIDKCLFLLYNFFYLSPPFYQGKQRVKKILYDKYTPMLAIRDGHVDNHFNDKFVSLCHVGYFINGYLQKLTTEYICHTFYTFGD